MDNFITVVISKLLLPLTIFLIGLVLGRKTDRLDDRSISAAGLFVFVPFYFFRLSMSQNPAAHEFVFILFFIFFHTLILFGAAYKAFQLLEANPRTRRLMLTNTLIVSIFGMRFIQPLLGDPAAALQTVNIQIFYHALILATLGIFLLSHEVWAQDRLLAIFKTPLIYVLGLGFLVSLFHPVVPYPVLEVIDSMHGVVYPLCLLIAGILFGKQVFFSEMGEYLALLPALGLCVFFRLIFSPVLAMAIVPLMNMDNVTLERSLVLGSGMPTGLLAALLVSYYGKSHEKRFTILCIVGSTLLHFLTLPLLENLTDSWFPV
ncbi:MAG: hypothetical protein HPY51_02585 [Candidatus Omnitrophica bacterium]|nr:hypothetical protein [Candidatus Omnitrophota bacterium]